MFDYKKFENDIVQEMGIVLDEWILENDDLYIFSLDCSREMDSIGIIANTSHYLMEQAELGSEDYWYYKYCEEEWDLFHTFEVISACMGKYLDDNSDIFISSDTHRYSEVFEEHCNKIIECCKNALICFRTSINQSHSNILLTFNIREYLDREDRIRIFERINRENAIKEYSEHIEEFA